MHEIGLPLSHLDNRFFHATRYHRCPIRILVGLDRSHRQLSLLFLSPRSNQPGTLHKALLLNFKVEK